MITLKNVFFKYKKGLPLFNKLNLTLSKGHIYGLLGKNGAGKTTLLNHINGMTFPTSGDCEVLGFPTKDRIPEVFENIFFVPEEFELPDIEGEVFMKRNAVFYPNFDIQLFERYLQEFELKTNCHLTQLSFGSKKKFLLAFGLATNTSILILDEPTNGLDIPSKGQFRRIIESIKTSEKVVIISTHQVRDLENLIDFVVVIENGKIVFEKDILAISNVLSFNEEITALTAQEVLYSEHISGSEIGVCKNTSGVNSKVNLELLFNSIITNPTGINHVFNQN